MARRLTKAEKAALTKPHFRELWGRKYKVEPALVEKVFGDGKKLLCLTPLMTRPNYYVVQIDSKWELDAYEFLDRLEEIYDAIEEQYGCDGDEFEGDEPPEFPTLHHGGSTWGELDFPRKLNRSGRGRSSPRLKPGVSAPLSRRVV
jgi:hypothetical protein